jgi:hypothetical protein
VNKTQQLKLVQEAYMAIPDLHDSWIDVRDKLYDMNYEAEKRHRRGAPDGIAHGISANQGAKLFTVSHLLDGFAQPDKWTVDDILSIRNEVLYAQAYAKKFHKELTAWAQEYSEPFKQVDYAFLMKVGTV